MAFFLSFFLFFVTAKVFWHARVHSQKIHKSFNNHVSLLNVICQFLRVLFSVSQWQACFEIWFCCAGTIGVVTYSIHYFRHFEGYNFFFNFSMVHCNNWNFYEHTTCLQKWGKLSSEYNIVFKNLFFVQQRNADIFYSKVISVFLLEGEWLFEYK